MAELVKVVVDAMGGDLAPVEPVKAAVEAVKERKDILVILTGQEEVVHSELKKYQDYPTDRIQVVNATEVIETAEPPVFAIRKKKDSSIVVGLKIVDIVDNNADFHRLHPLRDKGTVGFHGLFIQRTGHYIVVGKLNEGIAHFLYISLIGGLPKKNRTNCNKTGNNRGTQQKMLE